MYDCSKQNAAVIAACCIQKLHATMAHETTALSNKSEVLAQPPGLTQFDTYEF